MYKHVITIIKNAPHIFLFGTVLLGLSACSGYSDNHDHPDLKSGQDLYNYHCSGCHGEDGTGMLADHTPAATLTHKGRQSVANYITQEINPNRKMPVFKNMPGQEADKIASHLLKLKREYDALPAEHKKNPQLLIEP